MTSGVNVPNNEELPVFDAAKLEKALGGKVTVRGHMKRMTARAITDCDGSSPDNKFLNVEAWIQNAYGDGYNDGLNDMDRSWKNKIRSLFGMEIK